MYTVLLVDDEEKILEVMKVRIGWQELGPASFTVWMRDGIGRTGGIGGF